MKFVFGTIILAALSVTATSASDVGSIGGIVTTPAGRPAIGATVLVRSGTFSATAATNAQGQFALLWLPRGLYTIVAQGPLAASADLAAICVQGGDAVRLSLREITPGFDARLDEQSVQARAVNERTWLSRTTDETVVGGC